MIILDTLITLSEFSKKLEPTGILTIKRQIDPLHEYWIKHAKEVLMALPSSGQLTLDDIKTELGVSGQASLRSMSSTAGKTTPDLVSDFYGYSSVSNVRWEQPVLTNVTLAASPQYIYGTGIWYNFSGTRNDTNVTATTVGYQFTVNFTNYGGGSAVCGPTSGSSTYGSHSTSAPPGYFTFILSSVTTAGRSDMYFTGSASS